MKEILKKEKKKNKEKITTLLEKKCNLEPFCPVFRTLGKKGSQKGSLHVQEP